MNFKKIIKDNSFFTLIELIVVIVILGILAAIVIPNVSNVKEDSIRAEIISNTRNLQTIVDLYAEKHNGQVPTKESPQLGKPQFIDFEMLYPKSSKTKKSKNGYYWVDSNNEVWGSTILPPSNIMVENNKASWEGVPYASGYETFTVEKAKVTGSTFLNRSLKSLSFIRADNNKIQHLELPNENLNVYVSAYDKLGLPTPPVGEGNISEVDFPVTGEISFSLVTNANGLASWDGFTSIEDKPAGTDIIYQFATSDNGKDYSPFQSSTEGLKNSQYLKVNVQLKGNGNLYPTLYSLKMHFHLFNKEEIYFLDYDNFISIDTPSQVSLPNDTYIESVSIVGNYSKGDMPKLKYQTVSSSGVPSEWTHYESELPKGNILFISNGDTGSSGSSSGNSGEKNIDGFIIKTTTENPNSLPSSPLPKELENKLPTSEQSVEDNWETITSFGIIEDATNEGDWIKVDTVENNPEGTRISYSYFYSNDGLSWSNSYTDVSSVPNSRYLKVKVVLEREKGISELPKLEEMTIHYNGIDGRENIKKKLFDKSDPSQYTSVANTTVDLSKYNNVIYVNSLTGSDTLGNGTLEKPYQTAQKASSLSTSGDALYLEGTFTLGKGYTFKTGVDIIGEKERTVLKGSHYTGNSVNIYRLVFDGAGYDESYTFRGINFNFFNIVYKNQYSGDSSRELVAELGGISYKGTMYNSLLVSGNWNSTTYGNATLTGTGNATNNGSLSSAVFGIRNATYDSKYQLLNSQTINAQYGVYSGPNSWLK